MNDQLLKYIEENKPELDIYVPEAKNWHIIQERLQKQKSKKKTIRLVLAVAALAVLGLLVKGVIGNEPELEKQAMVNVISDNPYQANTTGVIYDLNTGQTVIYQWNGQPAPEVSNEVTVSGSNVSFSHDLNPEGSYNGTVYTWDYSASANVGLCSGTYNIVVADLNGCSNVSCFSTGSAGNAPGCGTNYVNSYGFFATGPTRVYRAYHAPAIVPVFVEEEEPYYGLGYYYEQYDDFEENKFETPKTQPLSTLGIDVDGASYSNIRRFINTDYIPPKNAVKIEEMINYFDYDFPEPSGEHPFSIITEVGECPWENDHLLVQVAIKGESIGFSERKPNNLVFLVDVSGSMDEPDKLPLLKSSLHLLVEEMQPEDRIALVVYAGSSGLVLPSTSGNEKGIINEAIENLSAGGSTAGGEGIALAYKIAESTFMDEGNNRVLLATDGDFNVGVTSDDELVKLIEQKRETGVYLSVLGFGTGNLQSSKMEKLADNGNGNYSYIDNISEAKKVLVNEIGGTLVTIANDVKLQVEFNPEHVASYRLLGYENRILQETDFENDAKDAGDLGSGHEVIALYEIVPASGPNDSGASLRYQDNGDLSGELAMVKFRYKKPGTKTSKLIEVIIKNKLKSKNSSDFLFASAVAEFGLLIRQSEYRGSASYGNIIKRATANIGTDKNGYRKEFVGLVKKAQELMYFYAKMEVSLCN
jgi:Ca-activated chloride channel homolog